MENELLYRLALTWVKGIGALRTKILIRHLGDASAIFRSSAGTLEKIRGIGSTRAKAIMDFRDFHAVEKELAFLEKYKIRPLFFTDAAYPLRLNECRNAPPLLFYRGAADLNAPKILSVVGTRTPTEYGRQLTDRIIKELSLPGLLIVSGLAYGIDAAAHKAALRHHLPTIGVLGHGLDRIYPEHHAGLAREMVKEGGLLTEFTSGTEPVEHNFPTRNRIVAGMSDALLVIETGCRGGSMLTVENAATCGKKVFALPGRTTDAKSAGCNALIHHGKAILFTGPKQLLQEMQWLEQPAAPPYPSPTGQPYSPSVGQPYSSPAGQPYSSTTGQRMATQAALFPQKRVRPTPISTGRPVSGCPDPGRPNPNTERAALSGAAFTGSALSAPSPLEGTRSKSTASKSARPEPPRSKSSRSEPSRSKPARSKSDRSDPSRSKPTRSDPSRSEPARSNPFCPDPSPSNSYSSAAPPSHPSESALSNEERILLDLLRETGGLSLDELLIKDNLGGNKVSLTLLTLEMQGLIRCLPGKRYLPA